MHALTAEPQPLQDLGHPGNRHRVFHHPVHGLVLNLAAVGRLGHHWQAVGCGIRLGRDRGCRAAQPDGGRFARAIGESVRVDARLGLAPHGGQNGPRVAGGIGLATQGDVKAGVVFLGCRHAVRAPVRV